MKADNRLDRDSIVLIIQCLAVKNYMIGSKIIESFEKNQQNSLQDSFNDNYLQDSLLKIDSLKRENNYLCKQRNNFMKSSFDDQILSSKKLELENKALKRRIQDFEVFDLLLFFYL